VNLPGGMVSGAETADGNPIPGGIIGVIGVADPNEESGAVMDPVTLI
jgi:hypothetical protein